MPSTLNLLNAFHIHRCKHILSEPALLAHFQKQQGNMASWAIPAAETRSPGSQRPGPVDHTGPETIGQGPAGLGTRGPCNAHGPGPQGREGTCPQGAERPGTPSPEPIWARLPPPALPDTRGSRWNGALMGPHVAQICQMPLWLTMGCG